MDMRVHIALLHNVVASKRALLCCMHLFSTAQHLVLMALRLCSVRSSCVLHIYTDQQQCVTRVQLCTTLDCVVLLIV